MDNKTCYGCAYFPNCNTIKKLGDLEAEYRDMFFETHANGCNEYFKSGVKT